VVLMQVVAVVALMLLVQLLALQHLVVEQVQ
jgi:hypothetical protein